MYEAGKRYREKVVLRCDLCQFPFPEPKNIDRVFPVAVSLEMS